MNARNGNEDNPVNHDFTIYLDDEIFYFAAQHENESIRPAELCKHDLDMVGRLCRMLPELAVEHSLPRCAGLFAPLQRRFEVISQRRTRRREIERPVAQGADWPRRQAEIVISSSIGRIAALRLGGETRDAPGIE